MNLVSLNPMLTQRHDLVNVLHSPISYPVANVRWFVNWYTGFSGAVGSLKMMILDEVNENVAYGVWLHSILDLVD